MAVTVAEVVVATHLDTTTAARVLPVAVALVERYGAAAAPPAVVDEATIRVAAYLAINSASGARSEGVEDLRTVWITSTRSPLRASGAEALLSAYKPRRVSRVALGATE